MGDTRDFDRSIDRAGKKTSSFGSKLGGLAKGGAIGAAIGGVALLGKTLVDSVGAAKDAEQAQSRLEDSLKSANVSYAKHGEAIQQAIDKTSKLAAVDDEDLSDAFAKILRSTKDVTKATDGMALAADIAAARNISLEAATKTVEKGLLGNEVAFKKVGVEITKGMTATQAFEAAQKQFAGAAEAHGKTAAGAQEKLGVAFENLQEKIGQKLLPVLAMLAVKLTEAVAWAETNWPKFQKAAEPVFNAIKVVIDNMIDKIKAIYTTVSGVIDLIRDIKNGRWSEVWGDLKQIAIDGIGTLVVAMLALPAKILAAIGRKAWEGLSAVGGWIVDAIMDGLRGAAARIGAAVSAAVANALGRIQAVIDAVKSALEWLSKLGGGGDTKTIQEGPAGTNRGSAGRGPVPRARGGPVSAGMAYTVGENGQETLVMGRQSGYVLSNGAGGGDLHATFVLQTPDGEAFWQFTKKFALRDLARNGSLGLT